MELHVSLTAAVPNGRWVKYIPQLDAITSTKMTISDGRAVPPQQARGSLVKVGNNTAH
jgi:hypothetical protein